MWTSVYMSQKKTNIEKLQKILTEEGITVKTKQLSEDDENEEKCYEIQVTRDNLEAAQRIIIDEGL